MIQTEWYWFLMIALNCYVAGCISNSEPIKILPPIDQFLILTWTCFLGFPFYTIIQAIELYKYLTRMPTKK